MELGYPIIALSSSHVLGYIKKSALIRGASSAKL